MGGPGLGDRHRSRIRRKADVRSTLEEGRHGTVRPRDINALPREDKDDSAFDFVERCPDTLIRNINILLEYYEIREEDAHECFGVERRWFRRLLKQGLERRMPNLDKVARFFHLADGDYLWTKDIRRHLVKPPPRPDVLDSWTKRVSWPYAQRLLELLETGQHEFLKALIDGLHQMAFGRGAIAGDGGGEPIDTEGLSSAEARPADSPKDDWSGKSAYVMPDQEDEEE